MRLFPDATTVTSGHKPHKLLFLNNGVLSREYMPEPKTPFEGGKEARVKTKINKKLPEHFLSQGNKTHGCP